MLNSVLQSILTIPSIRFTLFQLLEPKLLGSSMDLHPATVLFSLLAWASLWGLVGAFIAVPFTAVVKIICGNIDHFIPQTLYRIMEGKLGPPVRSDEKRRSSIIASGAAAAARMSGARGSVMSMASVDDASVAGGVSTYAQPSVVGVFSRSNPLSDTDSDQESPESGTFNLALPAQLDCLECDSNIQSSLIDLICFISDRF